MIAIGMCQNADHLTKMEWAQLISSKWLLSWPYTFSACNTSTKHYCITTQHISTHNKIRTLRTRASASPTAFESSQPSLKLACGSSVPTRQGAT